MIGADAMGENGVPLAIEGPLTLTGGHASAVNGTPLDDRNSYLLRMREQ